ALPLANVKANAAHTTAEILRADILRGSFALVSDPRHWNCARMSSRAHRPALLMRTDQNAGGLAHISSTDDEAGVHFRRPLAIQVHERQPRFPGLGRAHRVVNSTAPTSPRIENVGLVEFTARPRIVGGAGQGVLHDRRVDSGCRAV